MTLEDFQDFVKELRFSLELKLPSDEIMLFWYERVARIPSEAIPWIKERFVAQYADKFPKHFHNVVQGLFADWLNSNPAKRAPRQRCGHCEDGLLYAVKLDPESGMDFRYVFRCAQCNNGPGGIPPASTGKLVSSGYRIDAGNQDWR